MPAPYIHLSKVKSLPDIRTNKNGHQPDYRRWPYRRNIKNFVENERAGSFSIVLYYLIDRLRRSM
jgi:hypothetical protein